MLLGDSAAQGIYKSNRASAFYSYKIRMNDDFAVKFGVQAGLIQTRVNWERLLFGDQIDPINGPVGPDGSVVQTDEERPDNLTNSSFDVSAGMLVYSGAFYGGVSIKHLNTPDESLLGINQNLSAGMPVRTTVHAGAEIPLSGGNNPAGPTFISPNLMFVKQGAFGQVAAGAYGGFGKIFAGTWYRHTFSNPDAVILMFGYREGVLRIGYSYDQTISRLASAPGGTGGTHEISVTINFEDSYEIKRKRRSARYNDCFNMFR
jgi:type IX secretion system PorP/SprF family membrane protein